MLVGKGAAPSAVNDRGRTALHAAAEADQPLCALALAAGGCSAEQRDFPEAAPGLLESLAVSVGLQKEAQGVRPVDVARGTALTALQFLHSWVEANGGGAAGGAATTTTSSPTHPITHLQRVCVRVLLLRVAEMEGLIPDGDFNRRYEQCLSEGGVQEQPLDEEQQQRVFEIVSKVAADAVRVLGKQFPVRALFFRVLMGAHAASRAPGRVSAGAPGKPPAARALYAG